MTTLTVSTTFDFSTTNLLSIDTIDFTTILFAASATFDAFQFAPGRIGLGSTIDGSAQVNNLVINFITGHIANTQSLLFTNWSANDTVTFNGSNGTDIIRGTKVNDLIFGNIGDDVLSSTGGVDTMFGGIGNDAMNALGGSDFDGGFGTDFVLSEAAAGPRAITLDLSDGGGGRNIGNGTNLTSIEQITFAASAANDQLAGGDLADRFTGNGGDDALVGRGGNDFLDGSAGNDVLSGGDGLDALMGGAGRDLLTGDAGADRFIWTATTDFGRGVTADVVTDFSRDDDLIDLSRLDPLGLGNPQNAYHFIRQTALLADFGPQVRYEQTATDTVIQIDHNGDGAIDAEIVLTGLFRLTLNDFIL